MKLSPVQLQQARKIAAIPGVAIKTALLRLVLEDLDELLLKNDDLHRRRRRVIHTLKSVLADVAPVFPDDSHIKKLEDALMLLEGVNGTEVVNITPEGAQLAHAAVERLINRCGEALGELKVILADSESKAGGWGPDITMLGHIQKAAKILSGEAGQPPATNAEAKS